MKDELKTEDLFKLIYNFKRHIDQLCAHTLPKLTTLDFNISYLPYFMSIGYSGISNHDLLKDIKVTRQGVSKAIKELEKTGLVYTTKQDHDARLIMIFLTEQGVDFYNAIRQMSDDVTNDYIKILGNKKYQILLNALIDLTKYHQNL